MISYCDVTNIVYPVTMSTIRYCSILEFGRGASNQAVAPGITTPLQRLWEKVLFSVPDELDIDLQSNDIHSTSTRTKNEKQGESTSNHCMVCVVQEKKRVYY